MKASLDNLFPAIAESFVIILLGYLFGRFKIINPGDARSITTFVGKLALPALLFRNLAVLDLARVSWRFLGSILLAKFAVFLAVVVLTFLIARPWNIGKAGLYGIFATQSNDFALGLPIVQAIYSVDDHGFDFISYIYLFAPISLVIINPIGFFMMELTKQTKETVVSCSNITKVLLKTLIFVCLNPVVFMTALGVVVNVIVTFGLDRSNPDDKLPSWLSHFLEVMGNAYAAGALFNIGIFMVGKIKDISFIMLIVSSLLIFAKSILLPLAGYVIVSGIMPSVYLNATSEEVASFGFLYCTFPTAPTVFIYASQYCISESIIASTIVFGTFLSAPIMYVSARMITIQFISEETYANVVASTNWNTSIVSMVVIVWVFLLFLLSRRYRSYLHIIIMHLMLAQFVECFGNVLLNKVGPLSYWSYFFFTLFFIGVFASRLWTGWLIITLCILMKKGVRVANRLWWPMLATSWCIPVVVTVILVVLTAMETSSITEIFDVSFLLGKAQLVVSLMFLLMAFIVGLVCVPMVVLDVKKKGNKSRQQQRSSLRLKVSKYGTIDQGSSDTDGIVVNSKAVANNSNTSEVIANNSNTDSLESSTYIAPLGQVPSAGTWERDLTGNYLSRFIVLILFLLFSCLVGILVVFWQLVDSEINGLFVAAIILDNITNFGQGFFVFVVFGFEKHWFWVIIYQRIRKILYKVETVVISEQPNAAVVNLCQTFKTQYLQLCKEEIVSDKRYHFKTYHSVFKGSDLVDWVLCHELAESREDAVHYGETLFEGHLIAHISQEHYFYDEEYFYKFVE